MELTKRCSRCKEIKSIAEFGKNKARPDGLHIQCKICSRIINKEARQRAKINRALLPPEIRDVQSKKCNTCNETKPIDSFNKDPNTSTGYRHQCRNCYNSTRKTKGTK